MNSILHQLYGGDIIPAEQIIPQDPKYKKAFHKLDDEMKSWQEQLSSEQYKKLEDLIDLLMDANSMSCVQNFSYGFKLGMLLTVEVFTGKNELSWE